MVQFDSSCGTTVSETSTVLGVAFGSLVLEHLFGDIPLVHVVP